MAGTDAEAIKRDIIKATMGEDDFTEAEARAILRSISADRPEQLPGNIQRVIAWCHVTKQRMAVLEVILKMGEHGAIDVRPAKNKDISMRLNLEPHEISLEQ